MRIKYIHNSLRVIRSNLFDNSVGIKGSAYIEMGDTKVACSVRLSTNIVDSKSTIDMNSDAVLNVTVKRLILHLPDEGDVDFNSKNDDELSEKQLAAAINDGIMSSIQLHRLPNIRIDLQCTVIEDDGGSVSAALMCSSVAIANAGIEIYDLVVSITVAIYSNGRSLIDPNTDELKCTTIDGIVTVALMPSLNQISHCEMNGVMQIESSLTAINMATTRCLGYYSLMKEAIAAGVHKQK